MKNKVKLIVNPFIRIAGGQALIWGFLGLIVSTLLCWISGYHYHGLLHFGPAPNPAWWCYLAEHLIVWLIPALLFYLGGLFLSHSRIRVIDVLGTVLFAWNESDQPVAGHADDVTNEHEYVSRRNAGTALFYPGNDSYTVGIAVSDTYFDLDV